MNKKKVAVFWGGRSPEHDVSVVSGLQIFAAIDRNYYDPFPVYIAPNGLWYVGDALLNRQHYMFEGDALAALTEVHLRARHGKGELVGAAKNFWSKPPSWSFDIALPIFHGLHGEDGAFQGLMEFHGIPYAGMRAKAGALFMDKDSTKSALAGLGIKQLPHVAVGKPQQGLLVPAVDIEKMMAKISFPCCVKPANLGSSIGVGKATTIEDVRMLLANIFQHDVKAILEPFVTARTEYNIAVRRGKNGKSLLSAIERPKSSEELLDFKEKYLSGGGKKTGVKTTGSGNSQGMLSLTRDINPAMDSEMRKAIEDMAYKVFEAFDGAGAPRIDFMVNSETKDVWFNELNPIPGSYGYFLWEAGPQPILFTEFLTELLDEAEYLAARKQLAADPVPKDAHLLKRNS
jgi:D-alanine-D-alanine ligase